MTAVEPEEPAPDSGEKLEPLSPPAPARSTGRLAAFYERVAPYELWIVIGLCLVVLVPGIWSYTLIDPWETHYGEVGRRILEEGDWVLLRWQNEVFQSKPVLTFWLMAASMTATGVAHGGGYSGEMVSSSMVMFALRIPFVLFAIGGMVSLWWMLARLINRRVAWLSLLVIATCPLYFMVARQAITDMPMVACLMGAVACFAMAAEVGDAPLAPMFRRFDAYHLFLALLVLFVGGQVLYYLYYFIVNPQLAQGLRVPVPQLVATVPFLLGLGGFVVWSWHLSPTRTKRSVYMYWFYALLGLSALAKGPPAIGLAGAICLFYLLLTGRWALLRKLEIVRGLLIGALVVVPWHLAMWLKAGPRWAQEYFIHHMIKRSLEGVHGDRGTFDYIASEVGIGMWPWAALVPAALVSLAAAARIDSREGRTKLLVGIWAITGFALFAASQTKFHHYVLPAVPALGIAVALWIDDVLTGRAQRVALFALLGAGIAALIARDFVGEPKQLIELYIYRYDRPWPSNPPWSVDISGTFIAFGGLLTLALAGLAIARWRRWALLAVGVGAFAFALWAMNGYMQVAAPHWGQRALHETYYRLRQVHGVDIRYSGLAELARDWGGNRDYEVRTALPEGFAVGKSVTAHIMIPNAGLPKDEITLTGTVTRLGDDAFWMKASPPANLTAAFNALIARGKKAPRSHRPWVQVDADRLLAWQLNWRGENFWSSGEIWGETKDTQTVFVQTDNKLFLEYVKDPSRVGRKYFVITEAGRAAGLKTVLPTPRAKETVQILDTSCNKFTLLSFTL